MGTATSMALGFYYGGSEAKVLKCAAAGDLGKSGTKIAKYANFFAKEVKQVSKAEGTTLKVVENVAPQIEKGLNNVAKEGRGSTERVLHQRFKPDATAEGAHSIFRRHSVTGKTEKYQRYWNQANPYNPNPWEKGIRYDGNDYPHQHFNKYSEEWINTPHIHDPLSPGGVRYPKPMEIP